jgi:hypothetical protein
MLFTVTPVTGVSQNAVLALVQLNCPATRLAQASKARLKANIADLGDIEKAMRVFSQNKYIRAASVLCTDSGNQSCLPSTAPRYNPCKCSEFTP